MTEAGRGRYVGQPIRRVEDDVLVRGAGRYVDDLAVPDTLRLAFVRGPHAHARIRAVDVEAAGRAPGVVRVLTVADTVGRPGPPVNHPFPGILEPKAELLAGERVRCVGQPIAAVVATTAAAAVDAAQLVSVDFEPLPVVAELVAALEPDAPLVYPDLGTNAAFTYQSGGGDVAGAFARAAQVVRLDLAQPRLMPLPLEARGILASYEAGSDELTVWDSTQNVFRLRTALAATLRLPEGRVRVIAPEVGGSFGAKASIYREELVVALASRLLGRPVKWIATRAEEFVGLSHGRGLQSTAELALDAEGEFIGLRARHLVDLGAGLLFNGAIPAMRVALLGVGCYRIPAAEVTAVGVYTNRPPTAPYRGSGRPEAAYVLERLVDAAARVLGRDPADLRRQNFIRVDQFPHRAPTGQTYDSGDYSRTLDVALGIAGYADRRAEQEAARARGELVGIGLATFVEPSSSGWESGQIWVDPAGQVMVQTGATPHGQGHRTTFIQIVADGLGVDPNAITIRFNDTAVVPVGSGTGGSRTLTVAGNALFTAAEQLKAKARRVAAHLLEAAAADVEVRGGRFHLAGVPGRTVTWAEVARAAYERPPKDLPPGLEAGVVFRGPSETVGFGCCLAVVELDRETGRVWVRRLVAVDDCGVVINPLLVGGQVVGGLAQGLGQALLEEVRFDDQGQLLSGSLLDYAAPAAKSMPAIELGHTVTPSPLNPLGTKGVGESGTVAALCAATNAVLDALAPLGVEHVDVPLTSDKLWRLLRGSGRSEIPRAPGEKSTPR